MNPRWLANRWLQLSARVSVGSILIYAGVMKLMAPLSFADSIANFRLLPEPAINLLALGLPPLEVVIGGLLLSGRRLGAASLGAAVLMGVFIAALASAMIRELPKDCGCFGAGGTAYQGWILLGRNFLIGGAAGLIYRHASNIGINRSVEESAPRFVTAK